MSFCLGFLSNPQGVQDCIHPAQADVPQFLTDHMFRNLAQVAHLLGKSEDDVWVLFYWIVQRISQWNPRQSQAGAANLTVCVFSMESLKS